MWLSKDEYVAMSYGAREKVRIRRFLNKLLSKQAVKKIEMFDNNKTNFILTRNPKSQNRSKNIDVIHYHVQGLVEKKQLKIK